MTVQVNTVVAQRIRGSASVTITGSGFGAGLPQNDVLVSGSSGTLSAASPVSITFTLPFLFSSGLLRDVHALCQVLNLTTGESAYFWLRIKANPDEVADFGREIDSPIPGLFEVLQVNVPTNFEAKDMQRLATLMEIWTREGAVGQVLSRDGSGINFPTDTNLIGAQGQVLTVDLAEPTDLKWTLGSGAILPFGGQATIPGAFLTADGTNFDTIVDGETEQWAPTAGTIDHVWLLVKDPSFTGTLDRVRIYVNSIVQFDSGAGLGFADNGVFAATPNVVVAQGDIVEMDVFSLVTSVRTIGGCRLILDG